MTTIIIFSVTILFFLLILISNGMRIYNINVRNWIRLVKYIKKSRNEGYYLFKINTTDNKIIVTGINLNNGKITKNESLRLDYN